MENNESQATARVTVAGIGSSAGGLEALRKFFTAVPADLGLAYVVVAHLAPDHDSELAGILGRCTAMSVVEVGVSSGIEILRRPALDPAIAERVTGTMGRQAAQLVRYGSIRSRYQRPPSPSTSRSMGARWRSTRRASSSSP